MRGSSSHREDSSSWGSWTRGLRGRRSSHLIGSQAQDKPSRRERELQKDRIAIWLLSVMMAMVFLMIVLLAIEVRVSRPKNAHPTESAWYRQALPLFKILSPGGSGSILPGDFGRPCTN